MLFFFVANLCIFRLTIEVFRVVDFVMSFEWISVSLTFKLRIEDKKILCIGM